MVTSNSLPVGTILKGLSYSYRIEKTLGQGSFGITYLATMQTKVSGKMGGFDVTVKVAVKEFFMKELNGREGSTVTSSSQNGYFTDYKRKFLREAENLTKLQHPNIVKVLEAFEANGTVYYAMEYLEGGSLESLIQKCGALSNEESLRYTCQIASALECMHAHNMLHLDLKPGNVMLRETGEAVLIDFGLSKLFDENGEPESSTSLGGGTPGYAPLEQTNYQRGEGLPVTMDVYALGATLYKMLTGLRPPKADVILNEGLPLQPLQQKHISMRLIDAIVRAMAPVKRNRYQDISQFVRACREEEQKEDVQETTFLDVDRWADSEETLFVANSPILGSNNAKTLELYQNKSEASEKSFSFAAVICILSIVIVIGGLAAELYINSEIKDVSPVGDIESSTPSENSLGVPDKVMNIIDKATLEDSAKNYPQVEGGDYWIVGEIGVHEMQVGDGLLRISRKWLGNSDLMPYIVVFNGIENPDNISPGTILRIPKLKRKK